VTYWDDLTRAVIHRHLRTNAGLSTGDNPISFVSYPSLCPPSACSQFTNLYQPRPSLTVARTGTFQVPTVNSELCESVPLCFVSLADSLRPIAQMKSTSAQISLPNELWGEVLGHLPENLLPGITLTCQLAAAVPHLPILPLLRPEAYSTDAYRSGN
jgi:hypothetical protein